MFFFESVGVPGGSPELGKGNSGLDEKVMAKKLRLRKFHSPCENLAKFGSVKFAVKFCSAIFAVKFCSAKFAAKFLRSCKISFDFPSELWSSLPRDISTTLQT